MKEVRISLPVVAQFVTQGSGLKKINVIKGIAPDWPLVLAHVDYFHKPPCLVLAFDDGCEATTTQIVTYEQVND